MAENLVEHLDLFFAELFLGAQKEICDAPQRPDPRLLRAAADRLFEFGYQRSAIRRLRFAQAHRDVRHPLIKSKNDHTGEALKIRRVRREAPDMRRNQIHIMTGLRRVGPRCDNIAAGVGQALLRKRDRRQPLAVDLQIEHVETVVVAHDVVKLLGLDALCDVDLLIEQALALRQNVADDFARRAEHHRYGLRAVFKGLEAIAIDGTHGLARALVEETGQYAAP